MSDELNFLRWCYINADRFDSAARTYREYLLATYEEETGNPVPADYRIAA